MSLQGLTSLSELFVVRGGVEDQLGTRHGRVEIRVIVWEEDPRYKYSNDQSIEVNTDEIKEIT